jgi:hypothetical protein
MADETNNTTENLAPVFAVNADGEEITANEQLTKTAAKLLKQRPAYDTIYVTTVGGFGFFDEGEALYHAKQRGGEVIIFKRR